MRPLPIMMWGTMVLVGLVPVLAGCVSSVGQVTAQNSYTVTEPVTSVKIDNPVGDTELEGTDAATISVTERLRYSGNPPQTRYPVAGGQLSLSYSCPGVFDVNSCSVTYVVKIPRHLAVQIDDQVGAIKLAGVAGQLKLTSATGSIDATGLISNVVIARAGCATPALPRPTLPKRLKRRRKSRYSARRRPNVEHWPAGKPRPASCRKLRYRSRTAVVDDHADQHRRATLLITAVDELFGTPTLSARRLVNALPVVLPWCFPVVGNDPGGFRP